MSSLLLPPPAAAAVYRLPSSAPYSLVGLVAPSEPTPSANAISVAAVGAPLGPLPTVPIPPGAAWGASDAAAVPALVAFGAPGNQAAIVHGPTEAHEASASFQPPVAPRKRRLTAVKSSSRRQKEAAPKRAKIHRKMTPAAAGALAKKNAKAAAIKATALGLHSLDQHTIEQLQAYARERHILVQLYAKNKPPAKADYVCAILFSHLNALALGALKVQAQESGIDVSAYGTLKKDYVRALIDHRMGQPGEALGRDLMVTDQKAATSEASSTSSGGRDDGGDQQLWRDIYLVGTEWAVYDSVLEAGWDFGHLAAALAEGGDLYQAGAQHPVYLFGVTEPHFVKVADGERVVPVPAIVAVLSRVPPPALLGIKSVQMTQEQLVPMKEYKMSWAPYLPQGLSRHAGRRDKPRAFLLTTRQRRQGLGQMKEEERLKYNYALPYIYLPRVQGESASEADTIVIITADVNGGPAVTFDFDWEMDKAEAVAREVLRDNGVGLGDNKEHLAALVTVIDQHVAHAKARLAQASADQKARLDALGPDKLAALEQLRLWKFYPRNSTPDLSGCKVAYINRYYGKADKVL